MLDAPVSGGDVGAQNGTLAIMVGGDEAIFNAINLCSNKLAQQLFIKEALVTDNIRRWSIKLQSLVRCLA
ncbi:3-hydroxyisobutyrate dehydrogenase [Brochothrix campestris FSL F6-1037]|uniref:3-hydroxyisobutyrate dehydrogenase n=1 Tax=Brochothrix campestris FSL F6-1037 TaxID=1265861 RepID=W7CR32_9LIST|nr:3-hydroxyisobutyrate dehydrogenase [Brochothrix campestris FSL F6-1037]